MNILYTSMRNYYPYLKGAIQSLLDHNKVTKIYVFAEDDELPFEIPCKHEIINVSDQKFLNPDGPNMNTVYTWMSMMRIFAPEYIKANKLLYIDVDTIVCDSLKPLWDIDLKNKWFACCPEHEGHWRPFGPVYYNFGIVLMNLAQMRTDNVSQMLADILNTERLPFNEQDAVNMTAVPDKVVDFDRRYNESFCCGYTDNPALIHYAGHRDWYDNRAIFRWEYLEKYREG